MTNQPRKVRYLSDKEEAEIQRKIASDPDAPEATDDQLAQARPFAEAFPDLAESIKRSRGRPAIEKTSATDIHSVGPRHHRALQAQLRQGLAKSIERRP